MNNTKQRVFCIGVDVFKVYEGSDYDKLHEALTTLKIKKLKINKNCLEKYKDKLEKPKFQQDYWSRTVISVYRIGHDSIRIMKWLAYYDRSFSESIIYFDLMGSVLKYLNEVS